MALSGDATWPRLSTSYPMRFSQSRALVKRLTVPDPGVTAFLVLVVFSFVTSSVLVPGEHVLPSPLHTPHLSTTAFDPMTPSQPTFCRSYFRQSCAINHTAITWVKWRTWVYTNGFQNALFGLEKHPCKFGTELPWRRHVAKKISKGKPIIV